MSDKPHLSPTQLSMIARCGQQYAFRYVDGIKVAPAVAMAKGSAVDAGASHNFRQKIETHADLPPGEIVEASVAEWETAKAGGLELSREEESRGAKIVLTEAKDSVARMALHLATHVVGEYQPEAVQEWFRVPLPGPRDLVGIIDWRDDRECIVDLKTSKRRKRQEDADRSIQLTAYAAARMRAGKPARALRLETIVDGTRGVSSQRLDTKRGTHDVSTLAARINAAAKVIDTGAFSPAPEGAWWCSEKWCGYWHICPYGGKK